MTLAPHSEHAKCCLCSRHPAGHRSCSLKVYGLLLEIFIGACFEEACALAHTHTHTHTLSLLTHSQTVCLQCQVFHPQPATTLPFTAFFQRAKMNGSLMMIIFSFPPSLFSSSLCFPISLPDTIFLSLFLFSFHGNQTTGC